MNATLVLTYLVPIAMAWFCLSVLYRFCFRPAMHDVLLFRVFKRRDELRALVIEKKVDPKSFEYNFLEQRLCQTVYLSPKINVFNFWRYCRSDYAKLPQPEREKFEREAPPELKGMWEDAVKVFAAMMCVNSPFTMLFACGLVMLLSLQAKAKRYFSQYFECVEEMSGTQPTLSPA